MKARRFLCLLLLTWLASANAATTVPTPATFPKTTVTDVSGREHELPARGEAKATVLIFLTHDCPIANAFAPEIGRLRADYPPQQVAFVLVLVDPQLTPAAARQHALEFGHDCPVVLDRKHGLVKRAGATVTPEAVVLRPDGGIAYRGRIDDRFTDFGKQRPAPTQRDLRAALDAVLAGKPVPNATTKAIGCFITDLKPTN